jgi:2-polyprenyl-3-methyl-5-hydroxy-6-metoxy-1,4-benzoquinol methylase
MSILRSIAHRFLYPVPSVLRDRQSKNEQLHLVRSAMDRHYYVGWRKNATYASNYGEDLQEHLTERLESDRMNIIPWLNAARPLESSRVLEVGCGTGSGMVALAEQGAIVTGVDIDNGALEVAKVRLDAHDLRAWVREQNATDAVTDGTYDFIIYFATLEHMTLAERLKSLKSAWAALPSGGLLVVIETPNRLWYFDPHTSRLPFFHWLPDDLAFQYMKFSPRKLYKGMFTELNEEQMELFHRQGRGMSYHEIDLAIGPAKDLDVVSSLSTFQGLRNAIRKPRAYKRFKAFLRAHAPKGLHDGFFEPYLNVIIRKP